MTERGGRTLPRADVQALRALAVVLVVVGHAWPLLLPGGFVGVDVFFVISGYLVAGAILGAAVRGERVAIGRFLARRARRILPAASLVAAATALAFCLVLDPLESSRYIGDGVAALLFAANFRSQQDSAGYFSVVDPSPFRHYWSLGVEEQFYLVLPLLALALVVCRVRGRAVLFLVALSTLASFVGGVWLARHDPSLGFYMLPPRAWEFGVGALAALLPSVCRQAGVRLAPVAGAVGVAGVAASVVVLSDSSVVPGPMLLPAVLGTALALNAGEHLPASSSRWWAPFTWVGDRSYALYLTHWPPITWLLIREEGSQASLTSTLVALAIAVAIAMALHAFVERPLHRGSARFRVSAPRRTLLAAGSAVASLAVVALLPVALQLDSARVSPTPSEDQVLAGAVVNPGFVSADLLPPLSEARTLNGLYQGCHDTEDAIEAAPCLFGPGTRPDVVVMGDSHAANWYDAVRTAFPDRRVAFLTHTDCPLYDLDPDDTTACDEWVDSALDYLLEVRPKVAVLSNYTAAYVPDAEPDAAARFAQGWRATLSRLSSLPQVVVLGDVPVAHFDPPRCLARNLEDARSCDFIPAESDVAWNELEQEVVTSSGTAWVDTAAWFCAERCATLAGNVQIWRDASGHLTPESSRLMAPRVREALSNLSQAGE